ncbi:Retrotransposon-derived protein PEG10 AltName: Full=Embryonal carcinoma differentiation regulated protein [Rhizoctonia solani AG-1 IB]|uniref:Rhizoctonia solani AG1-IB WGS project CAOJ00000000 data, isolate 7/3/14, contig 16622 n=1 Tax=Thanatephorus cucumeris (strain AG1-IB / isolate 7/3/14) TaxID=1108050 RepID=M5C2X2_THACB|nr:Retrotransposon-derived protein PEG10 AltName: Full=Embryonal carcinoma differentiation regulated protein [Rhizoctonia solani AG-1 IB]
MPRWQPTPDQPLKTATGIRQSAVYYKKLTKVRPSEFKALRSSQSNGSSSSSLAKSLVSPNKLGIETKNSRISEPWSRRPTKSSQGPQPHPKKPLLERMCTKPQGPSPCLTTLPPPSPQQPQLILLERLSGHSPTLPFPVKPPPSSHSAVPSQRTSRSPSPVRASTAPTLGALTKVKVKAPEPYKGGIGADAKQWLARMMGWLTISGSQFASNKDVIMFLLINMEGTAAAWALPHIALIGEKRAVIKTPDNFQREFRKAFDDPDATAAAKRKITKLVQTTTAAAYTVEFRTLQLEIEWDESALRAQYQRGLNWQVRTQMAMMTPQPSSLEDFMEAAVRIDNVRRKLEASRPPRDNKPSNPLKSSSAPNKGTSTGSPVKPGDPHYVSKEEIDKRRANNQCIKCGREGHRAAVCRTGWKAPGELKPKEDKGKETAKVAETESIELENE